MMRTPFVAVAALCVAASGFAKLPPLTDEAKAKAAETVAKTAHGTKVADYQLCQAMDKIAAKYIAEQRKAGKEVTPVQTPPCADPGPFVPPAAAAPASAAAAKKS